MKRIQQSRLAASFRTALFLIVGLSVAAGIGWLLIDAQTPEAAAAEDHPFTEPDRAPRIATLLPFAADQLIEMGVRPVLVPRLRNDAPSSWHGIDTVALDHSAGPNIEQLMAASPDIVITSSVYAQFVPIIEQATGARILIMDIDSIDCVSRHLRTLGDLCDRQTEAQALAEKTEARMSRSGEIADPVEVLAIFGTPHAFYAFLPESYLGDLVTGAGGRLITEDLESHRVYRGMAPLSMEAVIDRDPEQLLVLFHGPEESARAMLDPDPLWSRLAAVRNGSVAFLQDDLYAMRPGSEMQRAMQQIRDILAQTRARRPDHRP